MREAWVQSLGWEDPLEKGKATHSSILAWRLLYSPWGRKELDTLSDFHFAYKDVTERSRMPFLLPPLTLTSHADNQGAFTHIAR